MSKEWDERSDGIKSDQRAGVYKAEGVGGANPESNYTGKGEGSSPKSAADEILETMMGNGGGGSGVGGSGGSGDSRNARPGAFVQGMGYKTMTGGYVRDEAKNAGGGRLATEVTSDPVKGDVITQGPRTVLSATQTLRPKLPIAGGQDVRETPAEAIVSNTVFETFSHLPEEQTDHLQAPNNRLNQLNRQNTTIRYMEHMDQPRSYNPASNPHEGSIPWQWSDQFGTPMFQEAFSREVKRHLDQQRATKRFMHAEDMPDRMEEDFTAYPSSKRLRRQTPSLYDTVNMNIERMLPSRQESGMLMNRRKFRDQDRGTWRSHL